MSASHFVTTCKYVNIKITMYLEYNNLGIDPNIGRFEKTFNCQFVYKPLKALLIGIVFG